MLDQTQVVEQVRTLMATTFRLDPDQVPEDIGQQNCSQWTSLRHMTLLVGLEERFDTTFSVEEMTTMTSLPKILAVLAGRALARA